MRSIFIVLSCFAIVSTREIPLRRCCGSGEVLANFQCRNSSTARPLDRWPISSDNGTVKQIRPDRLTQSLTRCAAGFVVASREFTAFENGSLRVSGVDVEESCLNEDEDGGLVVRYCSPSPCVNCVKKCCPGDWAYVHDGDGVGCRPMSTRLDVDSLTEHGNVTVLDGATPVCRNGRYSLPPQEFVIGPNGSLTEGQDQVYTTDEYCVENYFTDSSENSTVIALLCFADATSEDETILSILPFFLFTSSVFLIATFVIYLILPRLRNVHGLTVMCYAASLAAMYIGHGVNQLSRGLTTTSCILLASLNHLTFLSSFTWLNVMSLDIWLTLKNTGPRRSVYGRGAVGKRFLFYSLYAWGLPLFIVTVGQILQRTYGFNGRVITPSFGKNTCWFPHYEKAPFWVYLYGPIAVLIFINLVFFILTIGLFYQAGVDNSFAANRDRTKQKFRVILSVFFLKGVPWAIEVISFGAGGSAYIWLPFDIFNILMGVLIFVIFVCKPNVWKLLKKKFPRLGALDPCCPAFMKRSDTRSTVRSSDKSAKKKLSSASSSASNRKSLDTCLTSDDASRRASTTVLKKTQRVSSQSADPRDESTHLNEQDV